MKTKPFTCAKCAKRREGPRFPSWNFETHSREFLCKRCLGPVIAGAKTRTSDAYMEWFLTSLGETFTRTQETNDSSPDDAVLHLG